jgi:predicted glycoside hydrolase/deacetylase ChbG (UPF0249 family)
MRRLIVNADDFGLSPGVTAGILAARRQGVVTSATVLVTGRVSRDDCRAALDLGLGLGLHVNLTLGRPLTRAPSLVDARGQFLRDPRLVAARASVRDVEREITAQIERFLEVAGRPPTHLDSHHHVARHAPVTDVVFAQARRLGVPVRSLDRASRGRARGAGLATPDHFFGDSGPAPYWTLSRTLRHLRELPPGTSEFMTHPGFFDEELRDSRYGRQREVELVALGSPAVRGAAAALGIRLITFADL